MSIRSVRTHSSHNNPVGAQNETPAPPSSRGSASSQITSASVLASRTEFNQWASAVGLKRTIRLEIPASAAFKPITDLKDKANRFPTWMTMKDSHQFPYLLPGFRMTRDELCSHLKAANSFRFQDDHEDDLELSAAIVPILQTCRHNRVLKTLHDKPTEMDRRFNLDSLLAFMCETDEKPLMKYSTEQQLKVPEVTIGNFNVSTTTADGVLYLEFPDFAPYLASAEMQVAASSFGPNVQAHLKVVHCIIEYKRDANGANQAMMGMVSALYQKWVLGLSEQFVFGVFHYQTNFLQIVAGVWRTDTPEIDLYKIGSYSLDDPIQTVQFYLVLRGISRLGTSYHEQLLQSELELKSQIFSNPPATKWVPFRLESISEDPSELDGQPQNAEGSNVQPGFSAGFSVGVSLGSAALEQRDKHDRVLSYLESISGLPVWLPIDLPPSPPVDPAESLAD